MIHAVERVAILKWNWAGHIARMRENRWTKRIIDELDGPMILNVSTQIGYKRHKIGECGSNQERLVSSCGRIGVIEDDDDDDLMFSIYN